MKNEEGETRYAGSEKEKGRFMNREDKGAMVLKTSSRDDSSCPDLLVMIRHTK
jgi:hypothetical protein